MLASLLPGLRDLRVPLATGVLWLVVLWLASYPAIPSAGEATGLIGELYLLGAALGPTVELAVLSFIAYVVGILTARPTAAISRGLARLINILTLRRVRERELFPSAQRLTISSAEQAFNHALQLRAELPRSDFEHFDMLERMAADVPLVATRLLADNRELFDRYDRADAEAAFRFSVAPPLVPIALLVAWRWEPDPLFRTPTLRR